MATTYTPIATTTLGSSSSAVTFSSIPSTYTDLVLICVPAAATGSGGYSIRFNSDSGTNYSFVSVNGNGTSASSTKYANENAIRVAWTGQANTTLGNQVTITNINNYSNSTTYKAALSRDNSASFGTGAIIGTWRNTAAITSLTLVSPDFTNFATSSTFTLYGIKAA